jgi:hypothetical protein
MALTHEDGRIEVTWHLQVQDGQPWLGLHWCERHAEVEDWEAPPAWPGPGADRAARALRAGRQRRAALRPAGLDAWIRFPLRERDSLLQTDAPAAAPGVKGIYPQLGQIGYSGLIHPAWSRAMTLPLDLPGLEKAPASSVKTRGWPSLMRTVREKQALVITNHNHPEAVIVDIRTYQELLAWPPAAMPVSAAKNCCACAVSSTRPWPACSAGRAGQGAGPADPPRPQGHPRPSALTDGADPGAGRRQWRRQEFAAGHLAGSRRAGWFNPDSFTRRLVEAGWPLPDANAEAWQEGTRRLRQAMADGTDFAFETTLGGNTIPRLLREACEQHQVAIWFCGWPASSCTSPASPRGWPPVATIFRWRRSTPASIRRARTCWNLLPHLAELHVYDNSAPADADGCVEPLPVLAMAHGQLQYPVSVAELLHTPDWAKPIVMRAMELNTPD